MMEIRDNSYYPLHEFSETESLLLDKLADKTLKELAVNDRLLIFPQDFSDSEDLEEKNMLFERVKGQVKTGNLVGFLGYGEEKLTIRSRFSKGRDDYFLHYLLQKVLNINLLDFSLDLSFEENFYQLLLYLFPKYLDEALKVGLYKEYQHFQFNDNRIKGTINVSRHIKENTPFRGTIAYDTRQMTYDNPILQLIRHTIETLEKADQGRKLLSSYDELRRQIDLIREQTPSYSSDKGQALIKKNISSPVRHAYYKPYRSLQNLCLMILAGQKHSFGKGRDQVYGILFDVSWLWEDYLNLLMPTDFIHSENRKSKGGLSLFSDRVRTVYPDFYSKNLRLVLDAKYKKLEKTEKGIGREDLYQLISYSYILQSRASGLVYPSTDQASQWTAIGDLNGYGAHIFKLSFNIPQESQSYLDFEKQMEIEEKYFRQVLHEWIDTINVEAR